MLLRLIKVVLIITCLWFALPWFLVEVPLQLRMEWRAGQKRWVPLEALGVCLQAVFLLTLVANIWAVGHRKGDRRGAYELIHRKLLLYSGLPVMLLLSLSEIAWRWRMSGKDGKIKFVLGAVLCFWLIAEMVNNRKRKEEKSVYGLQHGKLHLDASVPMWMNMGYWKIDNQKAPVSKTLAEACRDLLNIVLVEAGFSTDTVPLRTRCLIDVGFGCGEQTVYLMSDKPVRSSDNLWWDHDHQIYFDRYVGITQDRSQYQYARQRIDELQRNGAVTTAGVAVFCADAAAPAKWSKDLLAAIDTARSKSHETWLLALDTAYHFAPSRWVLIEHAHRTCDASFMAFDLCLSPRTMRLQRLGIRILTWLMGAPWSNFTTPEAYKERLVKLGYPVDAIKIVDISEHVFSPLAIYMHEQDRKLKQLGLGLGSFRAAKWLFRWWGSTGIVRGVIVVARHNNSSTATT